MTPRSSRSDDGHSGRLPCERASSLSIPVPILDLMGNHLEPTMYDAEVSSMSRPSWTRLSIGPRISSDGRTVGLRYVRQEHVGNLFTSVIEHPLGGRDQLAD